MRLSLIVCTLITGISVYVVLSYLFVPPKLTIPLSVFMSSLSVGLVNYHFFSYKSNMELQYGSNDPIDSSKSIDFDKNKTNGDHYISNTIFVIVYLVSLLVCSVFSEPHLEHIYKSWFTIGAIELVSLGAAIILSFFLPGYAILLVLTKSYKINPVLKVLVAYIFSILITGLTVYLSEILFDNGVSVNKTLLMGVYTAILALFVISYRNKIIPANINRYHTTYQTISNMYSKLKILRNNFSELLVFGSLFGLLIVSTNYLYGGITIGDQWYHQNRALYFLSGQFKEYVMTNGDEIYTPFQSALIGGATMLSGIPLVNTYASIAFLNITAVFAFYYFCSTWFPDRNKRAALLASSFFLISSGFGWIYIISLTETNPISSQISSISNFVDDKIKFTDIIRPTNFMIAAHPDFSTGLIYISLPSGFVLLGLIRAKLSSKLRYAIILSLVSILGILSHDEFYFFIIISSLLPLIYNMQKKYSVYFALLFALAFTYTIDALLPIKYFTSNDIFGFPLIQLTTIFTLLMLALYALRQNLHKTFRFAIISFKFGKKFTDFIRRNDVILKAISVGIIFYLYALCFIVWDQLPANLVNMHTHNYTTPWYAYPLRLGIIGIIGVVSILSYVFRRFEKEVLVFGLIIVIALLAGPYYDEQRFNKYVMAGMIGFASLLIFKLLLFMADKRPILNGIIVSSIIISASLSTLMYVGYNALVIQTGDYSQALGRRNFPSEEQLNMFDMLRSKIHVGSNQYNVASYPNEYNFQEGGIMTKLHAFSGLPTLKIPQTHYLLNATTLPSFYNLIDKTNTKYILIPSNSSSNNQVSLEDPTRFAFENFQHLYDDNYLILNVPTLHGPSSLGKSEVGIIYNKDNSFATPVLDKKKLSFSNYTFDLEENDSKFINVQKQNQSEKTTIYGYKKDGGKTIWSKNFNDDGINYIESTFRIRDENKTGGDTAGLKWREGNTTYTVSVSNKGLELRRQLSNYDPILLLSQNSEIKRNDWVWYSLKIESLKNSINVYLDNLLKIKIPKETTELPTNISKVGLYSVKNAVDFGPMEIAKIAPSGESFQTKGKYDIYFYPLSSVALSGSRYNVFAEDDYSVLSNSIIVLPFDPHYWNDPTFNRYLNYVKAGGTLVVINSDGNIDGRFGKLLSMQVRSNNTQKFTDIVKANGEKTFLNVSGFARDIDIKPSTDTNITAYYRNNENKLIKPFAIEKHFTNSGRIIYINSEGYFKAIYDDPKKYFASLAQFSDVFDSNPVISVPLIAQKVSGPIKAFIGDMDMSGKISVNGSSLSIINGSTNSDNIIVKAVSILDKDGNLKNHFENLSIINMNLSGLYEVSIDALGRLTIPESLTQNDYVQISLPNEFNMTLNLFDNKNSRAEILIKNNSSINSVELNNGSKAIFYKVRSENPLKFVPVIIKKPLVAVDGSLNFDKGNFYGDMRYLPLNLSGHGEARFDFIDDLRESNGSRTKIQYLAYLGALTLDGKTKQPTQILKLPGEISYDLKKRGLDVPLISILGSPNNIALIAAISIGTMILIRFVGRIIESDTKGSGRR
jgi:hypothetical protein